MHTYIHTNIYHIYDYMHACMHTCIHAIPVSRRESYFSSIFCCSVYHHRTTIANKMDDTNYDAGFAACCVPLGTTNQERRYKLWPLFRIPHGTCVIICIIFFGLYALMVCSMQRSVRHNLYHPFRLRLSLYDDILSNERLIQSMIHDVSKKCKYRYIYIYVQL